MVGLKAEEIQVRQVSNLVGRTKLTYLFHLNSLTLLLYNCFISVSLLATSLDKNATDVNEVLYQCKLDCAMRFKSVDILNFHEKCHDALQTNKIICPECNNADFRNWNTLHTHLWRQHTVDMELYSCGQCKFKTPILSRLLNTHVKIHSEERNFKCTECGKAFKNTKQLKNHRRIHNDVVVIQKCNLCDTLFYSQRHLRNHIRSKHEQMEAFKCEICDGQFSSVKARRTHYLNHMKATKFKCEHCAYTSNDNNAYRRHRMTHNSEGAYKCRFCSFKSIQSTTYKVSNSKF